MLHYIHKQSTQRISHFSHGLSSSDSSLSGCFQHNRSSWKFIGYSDGHLGIKPVIIC